MEKLNQLIAQRAALVERLATDDVINDAAKFSAAETEISELDKKIERAKKAQSMAAAAAMPSGAGDANAAAIEAIAAVEATHHENHQLARTLPFDHYVRRARNELRGTSPDAYALVHGPQGFRTLGEQLRAVAGHYLSRDPGITD